MYCKSCGRKKVTEQAIYLSDPMGCCFTVDLEDRLCDECEAKKRAQGVISVIKANVKMKRDRLAQTTTIDEDKFQALKDKIIRYWKSYYTPSIDYKSYAYWLGQFNDTVDKEFATYTYKKKSLDTL